VKKQPAKTIVYGPEWTPEGSRERLRFVENASLGLRVVGASHDIIRTRDRHTGWYLDPMGDGETVHGAVLQLPSRDGAPVYVPAFADPYIADCYCVNFHSATEDKADCASWADSMAEYYAECERDYQTKESAKAFIEDARAGICAARIIVTDLVRDLRTAGHALPPSTRETVRLRIRALRESVHAHIAEIRKLTRNPYAWLEEAYR